jgi:hypothetical protein
MLRQSRQAVGVGDLSDVESRALAALRSNGVLRDLPILPGHADTPVEFSHPVLFDYAVALHGLGDTHQPESLVERLGEDPNLALTVRPSVDYRLATIWHDDPSRRVFWRVALRLIGRRSGHPLAAAAAGRVAASEIQRAEDCGPLAEACFGEFSDLYGRWTPRDAYELAFLVAVAVGRMTVDTDAVDSLAALT